MYADSQKRSSWTKRMFVGALGSQAISETARRSLSPRLRVLAYHGVPDRIAFETQLDDLLKKYTPITGSGIVDYLAAGERLPPDAVWITFDDGAANVVEHATPALSARGLSATLFVCPGVIENDRRHWWDTVSIAVSAGWEPADGSPATIVGRLKLLPDPDRRRVVRSARAFLEGSAELDATAPDSVAAAGQLRAWLSAGMELGNHTWDHPCLDRCSADEQRRQIVEADTWLTEFGAFERTKLFAYPNGDWTSESEDVIRNLGYQIGLLFDHRINRLPNIDPLRISRLRIDSAADVGRCRAVVSGAHSLAYRPARPVTRKAATRTW